MSWYNEWFNSEYYLRLYRHRDTTEAVRLVELILKNISIDSNSKILDMACGSGRHAIEFAKKGYKVTAVDLSQRLISEAKANALDNTVNVDFVLSDILNFDTSQKFHLAVNLFTSIGYFESDDENYEVIVKAFQLLAKGGYFVIEYFNKNFLLNNLIPTTVFSENGLRITQNRSIQGERVVKNITIENGSTIEEYYESVRLYSYNEMSNYIKSAGFSITKEFGDYHGTIFNSESSQRLIIFARK